MEEAENIVKMLNSPPLKLGTTVMDFWEMDEFMYIENTLTQFSYSQKSPMDLRQLLYQVLSTILPPQRVYEAPPAKNGWMMELLSLLNYNPSIDKITLRDGIANGSIGVIYQLLLWLLSQMTMLQKRAYLARFLIDVEIPTELLLEEDMNLLHAQYNDIREQFKATHRHLDNLRHIEGDPNKVKGQVQELETERDHLQSKIVKVKSKLQDVEKVDAMLEVVAELKTLKVEENTLAKAWKDQNQTLANSMGKHQKATSKLQQMESLLVSGSNRNFLKRVSQENYNAKEKLSKEVEKKQLHLHALQEVLAKGNNLDGLAGIQAKLLAINEEIRSLKKRNGFEKVQHNNKASKGEIFEYQAKQMGDTIANKSEEAFDQLEALIITRDELLKKIDQKNTAIEEIKTIVRHGEDFKQYVDQLRSKSATYKKMKKEIDDLATEYGVLLGKQKQLEQQLSSALECTPQDDMASSDTHKSTQIVKEMIVETNTLAKETRNRLTPQINTLKLLQAKLHEIEIEHAEKRKHYIEVQSLFERKVTKLEEEMITYCKELEMETNALNDTSITIEKLQASIVQLNMDKKDGSVSTKLSSKIEQQEELMNNLHQKQQKLKEVEPSNLVQMTMMKDLLTLLGVKLTMYSSGSKPAIFSTTTSLETLDK